MTETRQVTISNIFRNRRGTITYRTLIAVFGIALKIFFRRIETVNADSVPRGTGVIFVMNHPNGLIDPALVFVALPRRISFLAKSTLFQMPVIGWILRTVGALPLYRKIDAGEDVSKNLQTFEMCHDLLAEGGSIALFPEGLSHNSPKLLPLKSGASRIALGAASSSQGDDIVVQIVPVGLYYSNKTTFRSEALLHFGEPFVVEHAQLDESGQPPRDRVKALTEQIDAALGDVTLNAESESELHAARIAEAIFSPGVGTDGLDRERQFQQDFLRETGDKNDTESQSKLRKRLSEFDTKLKQFGLGTEHLSLAQFSRRSVIRESFRYAWKLILLLPFALLGAILHFPSYQLCRLFARWYASHGADDVASTAKVLAGIVFMPLSWILTAVVLFYFWRSPWVLLALPLGFLLGYAALYTLEEFEEARLWGKAIWKFLFQREKFLRLFVERRELKSQLSDLD